MGERTLGFINLAGFKGQYAAALDNQKAIKMSRFTYWATERPIAAGLLIFLMLTILFMIFFWRKDATYLTTKRSECPAEHRLKHDLFVGAKWSAIVLALVSIFIKF